MGHMLGVPDFFPISPRPPHVTDVTEADGDDPQASRTLSTPQH